MESKAYALLFRTPFWFTLPSDSSVELQLRPLSFKDVQGLREALHITERDKRFTVDTTQQQILKKSLLQARNAYGFPSLDILVDQLPKTDIDALVSQLYELSSFSQNAQDKLVFSLDIQFDERFDQNWDCATCQKRKLQANRACGMLPPEDRIDSFSIKVGGKRYNECPIFLMDAFLTSQANQAYKLYTAGFLPEDGGIGNQTQFFVQAAQAFESRIKKAERDLLDQAKRS